MNRFHSIELPCLESESSFVQASMQPDSRVVGTDSPISMISPVAHGTDEDPMLSDTGDLFDINYSSNKDGSVEKVTTIQEYTKMVMECMKCGKQMTTTEVAKRIMGKVRPRPDSLTVNIRRRVGDALSVLSGINLVVKTKGGYQWAGQEQGFDSTRLILSSVSLVGAKKELDDLKRKLERKKETLRLLKERVQYEVTWRSVGGRNSETKDGSIPTEIC